MGYIEVTTLGIHQPNFLPWLGYFYKIYKSDIFVLLDNVQYSKGSYQNRSKILTPNGPQWLTVPVVTKGKNFPLTNEIEINYREDWVKKHLGTLEANYKKAEYFDKYFPALRNVYLKQPKYLVELCNDFIYLICGELNLNTEIISASQININNSVQSTDRLIMICKELNADKYLSGKGGAKYQDESLFEENGISLIYSDFKVFEYPQLWSRNFEPGLSILDYLFNCDGVKFNHEKWSYKIGQTN